MSAENLQSHINEKHDGGYEQIGERVTLNETCESDVGNSETFQERAGEGDEQDMSLLQDIGSEEQNEVDITLDEECEEHERDKIRSV